MKKGKTINGIIWNSIDRFSLLFIQFFCTLIIARFLTPSDFGIVGMLSVFTSLGTLLIDSGFSQALIRKTNATTSDFTSIFYFNILLGLLVYVAFYLISPYIAVYYSSPELENILKISYLVFPISSCALIQTTILQKNMDYKLLSKISIISALISGIIGIGFSIYLQNVWALIIQMLVYQALRVILLWIYNDWRPIKEINIRPIKEMSSFSFNLLLTGFIGILFDNLYIIFIGKYYKLVDLGLYSQSKKIAEMPSINITAVIQQVTYSSLVLHQYDRNKLKISYTTIIRLSVYIITPVMIFLIITAPTLFDIILGNKWKDGVPLFKMLCIIGILYPISSINLNILKIIGKTKILLYLEIIRKIILCIILLLTLKLGLNAIIYGNIIYAVTSVILNIYYCGKEIKLTILEQLRDIFPIYTLGIVVILLLKIFIHVEDFENSILYFISILIAFIFLWIFISHIFKLQVLIDLRNVTNLSL